METIDLKTSNIVKAGLVCGLQIAVKSLRKPGTGWKKQKHVRKQEVVAAVVAG